MPFVDHRLFFPATARNQDAIAAVLADYLPDNGTVLEIASGSGEHAIAFQQRFTGITWQASDPEPQHRASITSWIAHAGMGERMPAPLDLDVRERPWPVAEPLAGIACVNLLHISPVVCTEALLAEAARCLPPSGPLMIYGPFRRNGQHTSASNAAFDAALRERNADWGLRDMEWVIQEASRHGLHLRECRPMPANNLTLVLQCS